MKEDYIINTLAERIAIQLFYRHFSRPRTFNPFATVGITKTYTFLFPVNTISSPLTIRVSQNNKQFLIKKMSTQNLTLRNVRGLIPARNLCFRVRGTRAIPTVELLVSPIGVDV